MSLSAYTAKTWVDYADAPDLSAANLQYIDSGVAAVTAEVLALEAALPTTYQPISAELSALAALSSTGYAKRTGAGAWSVVSSIPQADVASVSGWITTALAGKASSTHTHAQSDVTGLTAALATIPMASVTTPLVNGTAAIGTLTTRYALADHVHPTDTSRLAATAQAVDSAKLGGQLPSYYALASAIPAASSTTPAALGTAAVGTGTTWARADHVHAMPTAAQVGAVPTSRQVLAGAGLSGGGALTADVTLSLPSLLTASSAGGSASVPVITWDAYGRLTAVSTATITPAGIGAATAASLGAYLPLSAGSTKPLTGNLNLADNIGIRATMAGGSDFWRIFGDGANDIGRFILSWGDNSDDCIVFRNTDWQGGDLDTAWANRSSWNFNVPIYGTTASFSSRCTQAGSRIWDDGNLSFGTTANTMCQGNDSRLSDARTPINAPYYVQGDNGYRSTNISSRALSAALPSGFSYGELLSDPIGGVTVGGGRTHLITSRGGSWGDSQQYAFQIASRFSSSVNSGWGPEGYFMRTIAGNVPGAWRSLWHDGNLTGDQSAHYHSADRNRANHTGTQLAATISDFGATVGTLTAGSFLVRRVNGPNQGWANNNLAANSNFAQGDWPMWQNDAGDVAINAGPTRKLSICLNTAEIFRVSWADSAYKFGTFVADFAAGVTLSGGSLALSSGGMSHYFSSVAGAGTQAAAPTVPYGVTQITGLTSSQTVYVKLPTPRAGAYVALLGSTYGAPVVSPTAVSPSGVIYPLGAASATTISIYQSKAFVSDGTNWFQV